MEPEINEQLKKQQEQLDAIWKSVEKTRKMFLTTIWITIITFVLPLILLIFAIPFFMNTMMSGYEGLL